MTAELAYRQFGALGLVTSRSIATAGLLACLWDVEGSTGWPWAILGTEALFSISLVLLAQRAGRVGKTSWIDDALAGISLICAAFSLPIYGIVCILLTLDSSACENRGVGRPYPSGCLSLRADKTILVIVCAAIECYLAVFSAVPCALDLVRYARTKGRLITARYIYALACTCQLAHAVVWLRMARWGGRFSAWESGLHMAALGYFGLFAGFGRIVWGVSSAWVTFAVLSVGGAFCVAVAVEAGMRSSGLEPAIFSSLLSMTGLCLFSAMFV